MGWLTKLHERRTPPGREVQILRKLPLMAFFGSVLVLSLPVIVRIWPEGDGLDRARHIRSVDIFAIASEITLLVAAVTVAIGCVVVHIMKGPAYVADSFEVEHSDRPQHEDPPSPD